jgi:hypothetical protein
MPWMTFGHCGTGRAMAGRGCIRTEPRNRSSWHEKNQQFAKRMAEQASLCLGRRSLIKVRDLAMHDSGFQPISTKPLMSTISTQNQGTQTRMTMFHRLDDSLEISKVHPHRLVSINSSSRKLSLLCPWTNHFWATSWSHQDTIPANDGQL